MKWRKRETLTFRACSQTVYCSRIRSRTQKKLGMFRDLSSIHKAIQKQWWWIESWMSSKSRRTNLVRSGHDRKTYKKGYKWTRIYKYKWNIHRYINTHTLGHRSCQSWQDGMQMPAHWTPCALQCPNKLKDIHVYMQSMPVWQWTQPSERICIYMNDLIT